MKKFIAAAAAIVAVGVANPAQAASFTAQDLLTGFTNIVLGNLDASAETEGSVFVGGNYNGAGNVNPDVIANVDLGSGIVGAFIIGGNMAGNANLAAGNAVIGGAITGTLVNNGAGTVASGVAGIPVADVITSMQGLSTSLAANNTNTAGGTANTGDQNNINFVRGAGDVNGIQYFNIVGSVLQTGTLTGFTSADVTTIVNVSGTSVTVGVNANQQLDNVLFNFYEATTLNINVAFNYSILAPLANVNQNGGGIFGTVVSNNLDQNAEIRPYDTHNNFDGQLPPEEVEGPAPVPVPPALALMIAGMSGLVLIGRRKSAA